MSVKVCKFGGTSLADASQIQRVCELVRADSDRRFVVPSAPGKRFDGDQKITDLLYLCHEHAWQGIAFDEVFALVGERFRAITAELGLSLDIDAHLNEVHAGIASHAQAGQPADYAASRGEYLNGLILAHALNYSFLDPQTAIHFDRRGRLNESKTYEAMREALSSVEGAVVPGFYGQAHDGTVKTLSRGGSDVTGAIVARAMHASVYENWTDVSGLLMADPGIVDQPRIIDVITYRELRELSYMGAKVLHEEAVFPVRAAGIPLNIRNTREPEAPGTTIVSEEDAQRFTTGSISGIAGRKDFTIIAVEKAMMNAEVGFGRRVLGALENAGVNFEHMPSGIDTLSVVVADSEVDGKLEDIVSTIKSECRPDSVDVYANMALVATVGRGMAHTPGMAARVFSALAEQGVNIRMIDQGSSELNIIVGVEADDFDEAVRAIYSAFVDQPASAASGSAH
jgi:aspartate kinase